MAAAVKPIPDSRPPDAKRRVVRIPFPPKNSFWELMVEKGWALEAKGLRKDAVKIVPPPIVVETPEPEVKPKPAEAPKPKMLTRGDVISMFDEGKLDEIVALAGEGEEKLGLVVQCAIDYIRETSDYEKNLAAGNCIVMEDGIFSERTSSGTIERDEMAFYVLGRIGEPAIPLLKGYLLSESADRRKSRRLAQFLATSESPEHVRLLIDVYDKDKSTYYLYYLENDSHLVQAELVKALESSQYSQHTDVALLGILAKHGNPAMLEKYLQYLESHCEFADQLIRHLIDYGEGAVPVLNDYLGWSYHYFPNLLGALYALEQIGSVLSVETVLDLLESEKYNSTEWNEIVTAVKKVVLAIGPEAAPHIRSRVMSGDISIQFKPRAYIDLLGALGCDQAVNALSHIALSIRMASSEASFIREAAAKALGATGNVRASEPLAVLLDDKSFSVAQTAANAIEDLSYARTLSKEQKAYSCLLREVPDHVDYGDEEVYKYIVASVRHKFPKVRATAVAALGLSGKGRAVPVIISSLKDEDSNVRISAATALRNNREEKAIWPLLEALGDTKPAVVRAVKSSLLDYHRAMDNQDNDEDIVSNLALKAMGHKNALIREASIELMSEIGLSPAIPKLKQLALSDTIPNVRRTALKALGKFADQNINTFIEALGDSESEIVEIAIAQLTILEGLGEHAVTAALRSNKRPEVRIGASLAIARSGNPNCLDNLKNALGDSNKEVRLAAISNIGSLTQTLLAMEYPAMDSEDAKRVRAAHSDNAVKPLLKMLEDKDHDIRAASASVICDIIKSSEAEVFGVDAVPNLIAILRTGDDEVRENVVTLLDNILECCDTEEEVKQYLALIERSSNELRGLWGRALDRVSKKNAEATEAARVICEEFVRLAKEKEHKFENGHDGPYR